MDGKKRTAKSGCATKKIWHTEIVFQSLRLARSFSFAALIFLAAIPARLAGSLPQGNLPARSRKLPRPVPLGRNTVLSRDPVSGELHSNAKDSSAAAAAGTIRSRVTLVQAPCTVATP